MAINPNIILQQRQLQFDNPLDVAGKAMSLKQMKNQMQSAEAEAAEKQSMNDILKRNVVTGSDGKTSLNNEAAVSDMYKANPKAAMAFEKMLQEQGLEKMNYITKASKGLAWSVTPENYGEIRQKAIEMGLPNTDKLPDTYIPSFVQSWQMATLDGEKQLAQKNSDRDYNLKAQEASAKKTEKSTKDKELSITQAKQLGLYNQGIAAEKQFLNATSGKGWDRYDPSSSFNWIDKNDWAPRFIKSNESNAAESAQDRWVEAFLRDASGAAIPPSERGAYAKDFFPIAGDSPQIIKDKAEARKIKMESAKIAAYGGNMPSEQPLTKNVGGKTYVKVEGGWLPQE